MLKEISDKVIELFKADAGLAEPTAVTKWYFGPRSRPVGYSYGYVKGRGGPVTRLSNARQEFDAEWDCAVFDHNPADDDLAEKSVMDKTEAMRAVLDANRTLGGLVLDSAVVDWRLDVWEVEEGLVYGGLVVLRVRKVLT